MEQRDEIRRSAEEARRRRPGADTSQFEALRNASAGDPLAVAAPDGALAFWIVPYVRDGRARGFAQVELSGVASRVAIFGSGDAASWIDAAYFRGAPEGTLAEIRAKHPGDPLSEPVFSYDLSPARWGWRVQGPDWTAFITPGGWYDRAASQAGRPELEA